MTILPVVDIMIPLALVVGAVAMVLRLATDVTWKDRFIHLTIALSLALAGIGLTWANMEFGWFTFHGGCGGNCTTVLN